MVVFQETQENFGCHKCLGGGLQTGFAREASLSLSVIRTTCVLEYSI